jgi:hypothetical protein
MEDGKHNNPGNHFGEIKHGCALLVVDSPQGWRTQRRGSESSSLDPPACPYSPNVLEDKFSEVGSKNPGLYPTKNDAIWMAR